MVVFLVTGLLRNIEL